MKKMFRQVLSAVLTVCMICSLLPVTPVVAATAQYIYTADSDADVTTVDGFDSGLIFKLNELSENNVVRLDIGVYNAQPAAMFNVHFKYDTNVVKYVLDDAGTAMGKFDEFDLSDNVAIMPDSLIKDTDLKGILSWTHITTGKKPTAAAPMEFTDEETTLNETTGEISVELAAKNATALESISGNFADNFIVAGTANFNVGAKKDIPEGKQFVELYSLYFKVLEGKVNYDTFTLIENMDHPAGHGARLSKADGMQIVTMSEKSLWLGFPAEPPKTGNAEVTVKYNGNPVDGLTVTLVPATAGASTQSEDDPLTTTNSTNGVYSFTGVPEGPYKVNVSGTFKSGSKNYQVNHTGTEVAFTVSQSAATTPTYEVNDTKFSSSFKELKANYQFTIKTVDKKGAAIAAGTGAITFGGLETTAVSGTSTADGLVVSTSAVNVNQLVIPGPDGYQNVSVGLNLTPNSAGDKIEVLASQDTTKATVSGNATDGFVVTVTIPKTVTNISMPIPAPTTNGEPADDKDLDNVTVTFVPDPSKALGEEAQKELNGDVAGTVKKNDDGTMDVDVALPDGVYDMVIGGPGVNEVKVPVVVAGGKVTVGGSVSQDAGGSLTVTGSVTATVPSDKDDAGNGSVSLKPDTADQITSGGTVTVDSDGNASESGSTPVTGGLLGDPTIKDSMATTIMTDPMYWVEVEDTGSGNNYTAKVYLRNAQASSGTFGLWADPTLFTLTSSSVTLAPDTKAAASPVLGRSNPEVNVNDGYVTVGWQVDTGKVIDARSSDVLLATITMSANKSVLTDAQWKDALNVKSVNVQPYQDTENGKALPSDDVQVLAGIWRQLGVTVETNDNFKHNELKDAQASRGGFYQIYFVDPDSGLNIQSDVITQVKMPDSVTNLGVEFKVTDEKGNPLKGAKVSLYKDTDITANIVNGADPLPASYLEDTTGENGVAIFSLLAPGGTYYYKVEHGGSQYWSYPNGRFDTDTDNLVLDCFAINSAGVTMKTDVFPDAADEADKKTPYKEDAIQVVMNSKSYHKTSAAVDGASSGETVTLSGSAKAYDGMEYTFTLTPGAGWTWSDPTNMQTIADGITVKLFETNKDSTDATAAGENAMYHVGTPTESKNNGTTYITWDSTAKVFKLVGTVVNGEPVGANVDTNVAEQTWFDALRGGDLVFEVPASLLTHAEYVITASVDANVTLNVAEPSDTRGGSSEYQVGSDSTTTTPPTGDQAGPATVTEKLKDGRTDSADYNFKPADGYVIDQVIVNGTPLPLTKPQQENPAGFTYQFQNVTGNESIVVTVKKADGTAVANPTVSLTLGDYGKAVFNGSSTAPGAAYTSGTDINGACGPTVYSFAKDTALTVTITPTSSYQFDTVIVDENTLDLTDSSVYTGTDSNGFYTGALTYTFDAAAMAAGETHRVIVTFKEAKPDAPSIQAVVEAIVEKGLGMVYASGPNVKPVGTTASFTMKPFSNIWLLDTTANSGALKVETPDSTADADESAAVVTDSDGYSYTTKPLQGGNTLVKVYFTEKMYQVKGKIGISYPGSEKDVEAATMVFTRAEDSVSMTDEERFTRYSDNRVAMKDADNGLLSFDFKLPAGTYTLVVSKHGYQDYTIENFTLGTTAVEFGKAGDSGDQKVIELVPGDASWDGKRITVADIGAVANGWYAGASDLSKAMGDINESTYNYPDFKNGRACDTKDMTLVTANLNHQRVKVAYDAFCTGA